VSLFSAGNVAREQDDPCRLQAAQQGGKAGGHLGAIEPDDEKLADAAA
jgi:hypothetical protein